MLFYIRLLSEKDTPAFRQMRLESFVESAYAFSESYEDEVKRPLSSFSAELKSKGNPPEYFVLGAFAAQDQLAGFVKFRRDPRSKARHKSMLYAMYVDSDFRRMGLGRKLIDSVLERVSKLPGLEQIHLWALHAETSVADFYRKCGFLGQGPLVKKDLKIGEDYIDAEYMVLYL